MTTRAIWAVLLAAAVACAAPMGAAMPPLPSPEAAGPKKIRTMEEYRQYEQTMQKAAGAGLSEAWLALGMLHLEDLRLEGGKVVPKDVARAESEFRRAAELGNDAAVYYLAMIDVWKGRPYRAVAVLEPVIRKYPAGDPGAKLFAFQYISIVLDHLYRDKEALKRARRYALPYAQEDPKVRYMLAHVEHLLGHTRQADRLLDSACRDPKMPPAGRKMCYEDPNVEVYTDASAARPSCPPADR